MQMESTFVPYLLLRPQEVVKCKHENAQALKSNTKDEVYLEYLIG